MNFVAKIGAVTAVLLLLACDSGSEPPPLPEPEPPPPVEEPIQVEPIPLPPDKGGPFDTLPGGRIIPAEDPVEPECEEYLEINGQRVPQILNPSGALLAYQMSRQSTLRMRLTACPVDNKDEVIFAINKGGALTGRGSGQLELTVKKTGSLGRDESRNCHPDVTLVSKKSFPSRGADVRVDDQGPCHQQYIIYPVPEVEIISGIRGSGDAEISINYATPHGENFPVRVSTQ
jgi:hypothetical protein